MQGVSVVIPAHDEAAYIGTCIESIQSSAARADAEPDVIVVLNRCSDATESIATGLGARCVTNDERCIAAIRNTGIAHAEHDRILTIDADSWMGDQTVAEAIRLLDDARFVGGGTVTVPERMSFGIAASLVAIAPYLITKRISGGMFWFRRDDVDAIGGFDESLLSLEDLDFGRRLRAHGKTTGRKYGTIRRGRITTSARKFDQFGDWYLARNPRLVRRIFSGTDAAAVDHFYYDVERPA